MDNYRISREEMIANVIGARYSINDQIAILRQRDTKPEEYQAFFDFAEEVKRKVTEEYAALEAAEKEDIYDSSGESDPDSSGGAGLPGEAEQQ